MKNKKVRTLKPDEVPRKLDWQQLLLCCVIITIVYFAQGCSEHNPKVKPINIERSIYVYH